jgi:hypothetical protein
LTTLDLGSGATPKAEVRASFRAGWFQNVRVMVYGAGSAALTLGAYEIFRSQPDRSFALLQTWGPAFLVAMVAILVFGKIAEIFVQAMRESFGSLAESVRDSARSGDRTADALTRVADMGGEQARETQRLAMFAAQNSQEVYERLDRQDTVLDGLVESVNAIRAHLCAGPGGGQNDF